MSLTKKIRSDNEREGFSDAKTKQENSVNEIKGEEQEGMNKKRRGETLSARVPGQLKKRSLSLFFSLCFLFSAFLIIQRSKHSRDGVGRKVCVSVCVCVLSLCFSICHFSLFS